LQSHYEALSNLMVPRHVWVR